MKLDLMLPGFLQSSHSFLVFAMLETVKVIWHTGRSPITQTNCRGLHLDPLRTKNKDEIDCNLHIHEQNYCLRTV